MSQLSTPYVAEEWRGPDFSTWTLGGQWNVNGFSSLAKGQDALWCHTAGTGVFPDQTVDPHYDGVESHDFAESPAFDLSAFGSPDEWGFLVRAWWRASHVAPTLGGSDQEEHLRVFVEANGSVMLVGELDQPIIDAAGITTSQRLSRVAGDAGDPEVGADGDWWYQQVLTAPEAVQVAVIGQASVKLLLGFQANERDASGYGIGIEKMTVEIVRGKVTDDTQILPAHLLPSYVITRRWI